MENSRRPSLNLFPSILHYLEDSWRPDVESDLYAFEVGDVRDGVPVPILLPANQITFRSLLGQSAELQVLKFGEESNDHSEGHIAFDLVHQVCILCCFLKTDGHGRSQEGGGGDFKLVGFNQAIGLVSPLRRQICLNPVLARWAAVLGFAALTLGPFAPTAAAPLSPPLATPLLCPRKKPPNRIRKIT